MSIKSNLLVEAARKRDHGEDVVAGEDEGGKRVKLQRGRPDGFDFVGPRERAIQVGIGEVVFGADQVRGYLFEFEFGFVSHQAYFRRWLRGRQELRGVRGEKEGKPGVNTREGRAQRGSVLGIEVVGAVIVISSRAESAHGSGEVKNRAGQENKIVLGVGAQLTAKNALSEESGKLATAG